MTVHNPLNVYFGKDALRNYFNPEYAPPLALVEIPDTLNPFYKDGVRIYVKLMSTHAANNVKAIPALNLLEEAVKPGKTKTVIEYSSGSTVISMAMIARIFHGISDCRAYLSNKTSDAKLKLMQFFGLDLTLFPGPSQPEPYDVRGGIQIARAQAFNDDSICNPNQYEHEANWRAHYKWTGPQILKQLPDINVLCCGVGTSGTMTGIGHYLYKHKPSVVRVGVFTAEGDRVPGPRPHSLMEPVRFPWEDAIDHKEAVGSFDSYALSMKLSREGIICGPSSGFNLKGLWQFLEKQKAAGTLCNLANPNGEIHCVFIACDLPYQYIDAYFDKLDESWFPPIHQRHLTEVDHYNNYDDLEHDIGVVLAEFYDGTFSVNQPYEKWLLRREYTILDIRPSTEFVVTHLPGAINIPIKSLTAESASPWRDSHVMATQWTELESIFGGGSLETASPIAQILSQKKKVLLVCKNGDTARIAASILGAKGATTENLRGGMQGFESWVKAAMSKASKELVNGELQSNSVEGVPEFEGVC
ncbi:cysteine synthase B [Lojkania enalia]|uniref:Cysteine synthase B n=1 Tax=Lojkania enalia TaxID=147567 RepID=A0A9P4N471_9PLEO|nr:cysteine synthase B [Didymosphaeria enalia]